MRVHHRSLGRRVFFWFLGTALLSVHFVFTDPRFDYRLLLVGAVLPDLIDVPFGQRHGYMGTHNHLLQLGETVYLEIVALDPDASFVVEAPRVLHRNKVTPYQGRTLRGVVRGTWVRGVKVYDGKDPICPMSGRWIARGSK